MASLVPTDVFVMVTPIVIIGTIYYLLVRLRQRGLSRPVHAGFLVTLAILVIWGVYLLVMVSTGGGFSRLILFDWEDYFLPVTVGSFCLAWSVVTLWDFRTRPADVALREASRAWVMVQAFLALIIVALAVMALLAYGYREYQLGVAGNNNIAPQRLRAIYHSRHAGMDSQVMKRLASNTATPIEVLQQLARYDDNSVRRSVCDNPSTPLSLLSGLVTDENWGIRWCVAEHPNVSVAILAQLASDQSMNVRQNVAQNPAAPPEALLKLSHDNSHYVRTFVAMNKVSPAAALAILATDKQQSVRHLVARHPALPLKQQMQLAEDKSVIVRRALLSKLIVPREVLAKLENDPDETIRRRVQECYDYYRRLEKQAGKRH